MGSLRSLTVSQQIGLLFVAIFGLLILAAVAAFWRSLKDMTPRQSALHHRLVLDLRAVWIGTVLFWISWALGAAVATVLFAVVSFLALREFITLTHTRRADHRALLAVFFVVLPLQYVLAAGRAFNLFSVFIPVYAFAALPILAALGNDAHRFLERTAKIQWGTMVCVYGMSHAPALLLLSFPRYEERGAFLVLYIVPSPRSSCSTSCSWWPSPRSRTNWRPAACAAAPSRATSTATCRGAPGSSRRWPAVSWADCCTGSRRSSHRSPS
jgi:phosphatidate cytidylyltransferase